MKKTKRSLLTSLVTLLLCSAMFIGSTFAWFTDTVSNTGNKIQAGTLKIDLLESKTTMTSDQLAISGVSEEKYYSLKEGATPDLHNLPIFNYNKWEPGYSDVKLFQIKNNGNLALEWNLKINPNSAELTNLAKVIDVYYIESNNDLVDQFVGKKFEDVKGLLTKAGTLEDVLALGYAATGRLLPSDNTDSETSLIKGSVYVGLVLHMQEEADNKYQNMSLFTANSEAASFDINLLATQYTYEKDGFGSEQYDKEAALESIGGGIFIDPKNGNSFVKEDGQMVEVKQTTDEGIYVPANTQAGDFTKQYATTNEAIGKAIENINEEKPTQLTTYNVLLTNNEYDNVSMTFERSNTKDVNLAPSDASKRTTIKRDDATGAAIIVNSNSSYHDGEIIIENIDFVLSNKAIAITFGSAGGSSPTRYANNVTVKNCTAITTDGSNTQLVYSPSGSGTKNITIDGCVVNSIGYLANGALPDLLIKNCVCENVGAGVNNSSCPTTIIDSSLNCKKYCARVNYTPVIIENSTLKCTTSQNNTDEGALVFRYNPPTGESKVELKNVNFDTPNSNCDIVAHKISISKQFIIGAPASAEFVGTEGGSFTE